MKMKMFRISDEVNTVLDEISDRYGISYVEIIQKGILSVAITMDVDISGAEVVVERRKYDFWSRDEIDRLRFLVAEGYKNQEIADIMNRSYRSVTQKMTKAGIKR